MLVYLETRYKCVTSKYNFYKSVRKVFCLLILQASTLSVHSVFRLFVSEFVFMLDGAILAKYRWVTLKQNKEQSNFFLNLQTEFQIDHAETVEIKIWF